jgi:hypothetical protein
MEPHLLICPEEALLGPLGPWVRLLKDLLKAMKRPLKGHLRGL